MQNLEDVSFLGISNPKSTKKLENQGSDVEMLDYSATDEDSFTTRVNFAN